MKIIVFVIHGFVMARMGHSWDKVYFFTLACMIAVDYFGQKERN